MTSDATPVADVLAQNARKLRHESESTTGQIAFHARTFGLPKWTDGRISALERGQVSPTIPTLYGLALTFTAATGRPIGIADLLDHDGPVEISETTAPIDGSELKKFLSGYPISVETVHDDSAMLDRVVGTLLGKKYTGGGLSPLVGEAERKAAKTMGISAEQVATAAAELWGQSFTEERDQRVGSNFSPQRKGHVSRALIAEIRKHRGDDQ